MSLHIIFPMISSIENLDDDMVNSVTVVFLGICGTLGYITDNFRGFVIGILIGMLGVIIGMLYVILKMKEI